mmetsp:Transcript_53112/g.121989  ORF Transcript_53112/g.121989 Transcript_53112/m.121989 type:complete len:210 (+) Transcript_53112:787-1416(+)
MSSAMTLNKCSCSFLRSSSSGSLPSSRACCSLSFCAAPTARAVALTVCKPVPPPNPSSASLPLYPSALSATISYMIPTERHICGPRLASLSSATTLAILLTNSSLSPLTQPSSSSVESFLASTSSRLFCSVPSSSLRFPAVSDASSSKRIMSTCVSSPHQSRNFCSPNIIAKTMPGSVSCASCSEAMPSSSYFLRFLLSDSTWYAAPTA